MAGQSWPRDLGDFGRARFVRVERSELRVIDGMGSTATIGSRLERLRADLEHADPEVRRALFRRTGRLAGRSAVLRVGAATEPALRELASRAESALSTTRAALEQGIVPGGGIALLRAAQATVSQQPESVGAGLLLDAAESLVSRLASNAGADGRAVLEEVRMAAGPVGFHAGTGRIEDLEAAGVLDPLKVIRSALDNAVSVASAVLEAGGILTEHRASFVKAASVAKPGYDAST